MTQPENSCPGGCQSPADHATYAERVTRPAIGVLVDPERMTRARKSAMLERVELSDLSKVLHLRTIAADAGVDVGDQTEVQVLRKTLADAGITLVGRRIGVSRDEIAKLETGGRKRPRMATLRKLIDTINHARAARGKPPIDVEDLQVPGEVLIPVRGPASDSWDYDAAKTALDEYQEASNEIYYASEGEMLDDQGE